MFTGLVEGEGRIVSAIPEKGGLTVEISVPFSLSDTKLGDSLSVNGVCLTVIEKREKTFKAHISPETLERTTFKYLRVGDFVNLERALRLGDRLGGHLVSGHVDGVGRILEIVSLGSFYRFVIEVPEDLVLYLVEKGSIAVDGISLTINRVAGNKFELMIIPHTYQVTNLKRKKREDWVNIEIDMIAKMVYKWLSPYLKSVSRSPTKEPLDLSFLKEYGFA